MKTATFNDQPIEIYNDGDKTYFPTCQLARPMGYLSEGQLGKAIGDNRITVTDSYSWNTTSDTWQGAFPVQMISLEGVERLAEKSGFPVAREFAAWARKQEVCHE